MNRALIPETRFAVAFSGGGDSTALVHMLRGESPLVLIVDHGLRPGSAVEAENAKAFAESLGLETRVLRWEHDSPKMGLQEKARRARYGLMGQVCREAGITHLLTGHTEDDQAETLLMRYDRKTDWRGAAGMRERAYAPVWPELVDVTLVRPLLGQRRKALRDYNLGHNLIWVEDPSNANRDFTRIRARDFLADRGALRQNLLEAAKSLREGLEAERMRMGTFVDRNVSLDRYGIVRLTKIPPVHLLAVLLRVASGTDGNVAQKSLRDLKAAMGESDFCAATLAGALVVKHRGVFFIGRDPGVAKGRANLNPLPQTSLKQNAGVIWDGRFQISAHCDGCIVQTFEKSDLPPEVTKALYGSVPHKLRAALPIVSCGEADAQDVNSEASKVVSVQTLVALRLHKLLETPQS